MANHTPGPWGWHKARTMRHLIASEQQRFALPHTPLAVSMPTFDNPQYAHLRDTADANANLIAAAPDLLNAAEYALATFCTSADESELPGCVAKLRAAIDKAKGGAK